MHPALNTAIAEQYLAFERPRPTSIEGCPCCVSAEDLAALISVPLRELSYEQLGTYAGAAMSTVGTIEDFRYFWPRLAELLVTVSPGQYFIDPERLLAKLRYGGWRSWPVGERGSVEAYVTALLVRLRDEPLRTWDVDAVVCAVGLAVDDVVPLLEPLVADTESARHNLRAFYDRNWRSVEKGRLKNAFWTSRSHAGDQVENPNVRSIIEWLRRPDVSAAIGRAYGAASQ
jgi:hypothetical protein